MEALNRAGSSLFNGIGYPDDTDGNAIARHPDETSRLAAKLVRRICRFVGNGNAVVDQKCLLPELESPSVADPPCGGICCPLCGKAGIRLVAFTDAMGVLHMSRTRQILCDSS